MDATTLKGLGFAQDGQDFTKKIKYKKWWIYICVMENEMVSGVWGISLSLEGFFCGDIETITNMDDFLITLMHAPEILEIA